MTINLYFMAGFLFFREGKIWVVEGRATIPLIQFFWLRKIKFEAL